MSHLGASADLLKVARDALRETVAPELGAEARYHAAMIANAMAIAIRELELGPEVRAAERRLLGGFYDGSEATLPELRARLCRDLRAGAVLEERPGDLRALLQELVDARLAISNPGYAASGDGSAT
jgi:hypothetical protein